MGTEHAESNPSQSDSVEFVQVWLQAPTPRSGTLEQYWEYAAEDRSDRWPPVVRMERPPGDGLMFAQDAQMHVARLHAAGGPLYYLFEPAHLGYLNSFSGR
jgi:hypothetical protein